MIVGSEIQQPSETLDYDFDYSKFFDGAADTIDSVVVEVTPDAGLSVTPVLSGPEIVKIWVSGGTEGVQYSIEIRVTTEAGRVKEDEFIIQVEDI